MSATITLHPGPAAGFDDPFEMLQACHERVARMLGLLQRLQQHLQEARHADAPARSAASDVMRYFDLAAPQHHRDEELHVFPALLSSGNAALQVLVRRLQGEHLQMAESWAALRLGLQSLAEGRWRVQDADEHFAAWQAFVALYAGHAQAEDELAFPAALRCLDGAAQAAMGDEMARRRGVR